MKDFKKNVKKLKLNMLTASNLNSAELNKKIGGGTEICTVGNTCVKTKCHLK